MPRASRLKLSPIDLGGETIGQRLARLRKERGFTQVELAEKTGLVQTLVTDYECDRLRLSAEMAIRFAQGLGVTLDDLLQPSPTKATRKPSRKVLRRLEQIEKLPTSQQATLLRTIDTFLENAVLKSARR